MINIFNDINNLPNFKNAVITSGSFDGVHTGHVQIIKQLIEEAKKIDGTAVLISFFPHPKQVVQMADNTLSMLNTQAEKYELLEKNGIENMVVVSFNSAFAALSAEEYISDFLAKKFHPAIIIVGYDHRFGKNRLGNFSLLQLMAKQYNYVVNEIPEHIEKDITISSTKIRAALLKGDILLANKFLGYQYFFSGTVVQGNKIGRTIGYPTANLNVNDVLKLIPANAVYAVDIVYNNIKYKGMMNIGTKPTLDEKTQTIEVNIFEFDKDIYGEEIRVVVKQKLRDEIKFADLDALKKQLANDKVSAILC